MYRTATRIAIAIAVFTLITVRINAAVYTFTSGSPVVNYTLNAGDSLSVASGTYTGSISSNSTTAKITVAQNATFNPSNFDFVGTLRVFGTAKVPKINGWTAGMVIHNYYRLEVTGTTYVTGGTVNNYYGAVLTFDGTITFQNNNASLISRGFIIAKSTTYFGKAILTNAGNFSADNDVTLDNQSVITNSGKLYTKGMLTVQNSTYSNTCRTIAEQTIKFISGSTFTNNGLVWASNAQNNSNVYVSGSSTLIGMVNSIVKTVDMNNSGITRGSMSIYLTGTSATSNRLGTSGTTTDSIFVRDLTRTGSQIFDQQSGNIYNNVKFKTTMVAPDTLNDYPNCSPDIVAIPLAVKWNYFEAALFTGVPQLNWAAETDPGSVFTVERSYDNASFSTVDNLLAEFGKTTYSYTDARVNTQATVVYYRIKIADAAGKITYSVTRPVKFSNSNAVTVHAAPNPFTSQLSLQVNSSNPGAVTIRVISLNGQAVLTQTATVNNGVNNIAVTDASRLVKGMYMIQVSQNGQIIASEKIIRQ